MIDVVWIRHGLTLDSNCFMAKKDKKKMNIYVGNIAYSTTEDDLREMFGAHGEVSSARVITDRDSGRSKGFGFVEMSDSESAQAAIDALNGKDLDGRTLTVNEARPREERPRSGGGGGYGGGGGRSGGGGYGGGGGRSGGGGYGGGGGGRSGGGRSGGGGGGYDRY